VRGDSQARRMRLTMGLSDANAFLTL